jgi:hypothetical protein
MSESRDDQERQSLHCMMVELIEQFFEEYPGTADGADTIDADGSDAAGRDRSLAALPYFGICNARTL